MNPKNFKIMQFSKSEPNSAVEIQAGGEPFTTPEPNKDGEIRHEYLGFLCDTALEGKAHLERALGKAHGMNKNLSTLAEEVSEELALTYLETNVTPSVMYAMEMVQPKQAARQQNCEQHTRKRSVMPH